MSKNRGVHAASSIAVLAFIEDGLSLVAFGALTLGLLVTLAYLSTRGGGSVYDRIGAGGLSRESDYERPLPAPDSPAAHAEREREIRQMLGARSERLVRSGQEPLDVDAELARLLAQEPPARAHDPALLAEVRQLVLARNQRRARLGQAPLDVDAEVARTLAEFDP
ncbi:MAG TPA: hypothetical protein VMF09_14885 [Solirubrobacteraceae bacterium]|nr:hypothetical protein [Solirubrobacteraceae bacterium]